MNNEEVFDYNLVCAEDVANYLKNIANTHSNRSFQITYFKDMFNEVCFKLDNKELKYIYQLKCQLQSVLVKTIANWSWRIWDGFKWSARINFTIKTIIYLLYKLWVLFEEDEKVEINFDSKYLKKLLKECRAEIKEKVKKPYVLYNEAWDQMMPYIFLNINEDKILEEIVFKNRKD